MVQPRLILNVMRINLVKILVPLIVLSMNAVVAADEKFTSSTVIQSFQKCERLNIAFLESHTALQKNKTASTSEKHSRARRENREACGSPIGPMYSVLLSANEIVCESGNKKVAQALLSFLSQTKNSAAELPYTTLHSIMRCQPTVVKLAFNDLSNEKKEAFLEGLAESTEEFFVEE